MKTLHIIRNLTDRLAKSLIQAGKGHGEDSVLLMHDAVYEQSKVCSAKTFACEEDIKARQIESPHQKVSYDEIARLVTEYDRTIVW